jgi:hypothetical protein
MRDCCKLGKCLSSKESVVHYLKVGNLELQVFSMEIVLSPKGHEKSNLTNGGHYCIRDYDVEQSLTGAQCRSG